MNNQQQSYRELHSCVNCKHVFCKSEHDEGDVLFCTKDAPERPKCGSVYMREHFWGSDEEVLNKTVEEIDEMNSQFRSEWEEWSEGREVLFNGICDEWEGDHVESTNLVIENATG